jgi:hypothetical protein
MPIHFGVNARKKVRTVLHCYVVFFFDCMQLYHTFVLDGYQRSVFKFRMPNATSVKVELYYDIPYDECRCSVVPIKDCLTDEQLKYIRIELVILFVLEVYLIRELVSFSGNRVYFLVNVYWIVSMFSLFCILVIIYRSTFYYEIIAKCFSFVGFSFFLYCSISVSDD